MTTNALIENLKSLNPEGPLTKSLVSLAALRLDELQQLNKNLECSCDSWEDEVIKLRKELEETRPEPSRLEIAAMLLADGFYVVETALAEADALIAAAKEGK
jgi:predicted nuclease with TOPRIM domain